MAASAPGAPGAPGALGDPKRARRVAFPDDSSLVTSYLEPPAPFAHAEEISAEGLLEEYKKSCQKHNTQPIECLIKQIKETGTLGGSARRGVLNLAGQKLSPAACESLESIFRKTRFHRIDLHNCGLNDDAAIALFDMIEYYESAVELDISGNLGFGILAWKACSNMISQCQWLEQLEIRETSLSESSAPVLGRGLRSLCSLRSLHLEQSRLSGPPLLCLAGVLKQNKSVRELHLGDNNLVASDAKHLASMLRLNSSLQLLDVSNNDIQDSGIEAIAEALAEQSAKQSSSSSGSSSESSMSSPQSDSSGSTQERGLVALIVWNNNLTRNSGKHFSKALARCHSLEMLNMGQNPLCSETVNRLRSALQQNRSLLSLGMQSTRLGAEAAIALAEIIEDNPVIQRIDLRDNKLQTAGLLALATALKKNQTVTRIDLDDAPPVQVDKEQPLEEARLVSEIRSLCNRNELEQNPVVLPIDEDQNLAAHRRRVASFTTRKISLTCQTLHTPPEPVLSPPKPISRFRSPLPSPIQSPMCSPIPSPIHRSRFQVSRVSDSSSGASQTPSPSTPPGQRALFAGNSRFKVVSVSEPPSISVQAPDAKESSPMIDVSSQTENGKIIKCGSSRFSIVRNVNLEDTKLPMSQSNLRNNSDISSKNNPSIGKNSVLTQNPGTIVKQGPFSNNNPNVSSTGNVPVIEQNWVNSEEPSHKYHNIIKKNKSESSLDSPDLEVSRLMQHEKRTNYGSSSSLDISGSSMESLNTLETNIQFKAKTEDMVEFPKAKPANLQHHSLDSEENDVFDSVDDRIHKKLGNLSLSSNESSLDLSAPVEVPQYPISNQTFLNSSVSSNESVSPNIFGKHMKLHGSITSLEASVSSLDSFKSGSNTMISPTTHNIELFNFSTPEQNRLIDSTDSGIYQSENSPKTLNSSISSNDGTLTSNSNLSRAIQSFGSALETSGSVDPSDTSKVPKRASSLLDVPSSGSKQRNRKISWVATPGLGAALGSLRKEMEDPQQKPPSSLEKLLNLFQIPTNIFSRNVSGESNEKKDSNTCTSLPSTSGSFWPWSSNSNSGPISKSIVEKYSNIDRVDSAEVPAAIEKNPEDLVSSVSAEYTIKLADRRRSSEMSIIEEIKNFDALLGSNKKSNMIGDTPKNTTDQQLSSDEIDEGSTNELLCQSKENTGEIKNNVHILSQKTAEISVDGSLKSINRLSNECEEVHCDNFGKVEDADNSFIDSTLSDNMFDDTMNESVSITNCDKVNVQLDRNLKEEEMCTDNVTIFSTIPNDSIIAKTSVQNNLLLSTCDNDCRSDSVICGSQNDDECVNNFDMLNTKSDDLNSAKNISPEKDLLCSLKKGEERERNISRDLSVCSVTSSVNDTDTDNSPNTFDCYIIGSDNLLFNTNTVPSADDNCVATNNQLPLSCNVSNSSVEINENLLSEKLDFSEACSVDNMNNLKNVSHHVKKDHNIFKDLVTTEDIESLEISPRADWELDIFKPSVLIHDEEKISDQIEMPIIDSNLIEKNSSMIEDIAKKDKNNMVFECSMKDMIKPINFTISRNTIAANFSLDIMPPPSILIQSTGIENKTLPNERQLSPESGPSVENLPSKIIKRIKENISPENTLTTSMSNTQALAQELAERRKVLSQNSAIFKENLDMTEFGIKGDEFYSKTEGLNIKAKKMQKHEDLNILDDGLKKENDSAENESLISVTSTAMITSDKNKNNDKHDQNSILEINQNLNDEKSEEINLPISSDPTDCSQSLEMVHFACEYPCLCHDASGSNASTIIDPMDCKHTVQDYSSENLQNNSNIAPGVTFVEEAKEVFAFDNISYDQAISEKSEEMVGGDVKQLSALKWNDDSIISSDSCQNVDKESDDNDGEVGSIPMKDEKLGFKPVSILRNANAETVQFSSPKDIPDQKGLHKSYDSEKNAPVHCGSLPESMSGYSPKSLPDSLTSRSKMKSRSPINTLGKLARDSLYGLNMSEEEISDINKETKLERVRSLGSVSEDGGDTFQLKRGYSSSESRSLGAFTSQESLASLTSISETAGESDSIEIPKDSDRV